MTYDGQDPFEALIGAGFTSDERLELSLTALSPYDYQPVTPSRAELVKHFDAFLELLVMGGDKASAQKLIDKFLDSMVTVVDAEPGSSMQVRNVGSIITAQTVERPTLSQVGRGIELLGDFAGMFVGPWFDVPEGIKPKDLAPYKRENGLLVVLSTPRYACGDVIISGIEEELAMIPLNHGEPELFRVLPAPTNM